MEVIGDSVRFDDGTHVPLPGGLIGMDAEGNLWSAINPDQVPLDDDDLVDMLGGKGAVLGRTMEYLARLVEAAARGKLEREYPKESELLEQAGGRLDIPGTQVSIRLPTGVLAIGPDLDVWRVLGRPLWMLNGHGCSLGDEQAAQVAAEAKRRWRAFREEMVAEWCPPIMSPHAMTPESPRFA